MSEQNHEGGVRAAVGQRASGVYNFAQRSLDRVVPPSSRQRAYEGASDFAAERPILFSFIVSQLLLSFLPLLLFTTFALSTVAFSLGAALVFALFWISIAFMLLVPTLLVTTSIAVLVWGWAVGSFLVARWLYRHAPVAMQGDLRVDTAGRSVDVVKDGNGFDASVQKK